MTKYFYTIIISDKDPKINGLDYEYINSIFTLVDENYIKVGNEVIEFTYLMYQIDKCTEYDITDLMLEDNKPIVNYYHQTIFENIFCLDKENIKEQIELILEEI